MTDEPAYSVVVNDEAQYSIWLADTQPPAGWHRVGVTGTSAECLAHIERVWTDIRPVSRRPEVQAHGKAQQPRAVKGRA